MININIQSDSVSALLRQLQSQLNQPKDMMKAVAQDMFYMTDKSFTTQASPDGKGWKSLASSTLHQRGLQGGKGRQFGKNGKELKGYTKHRAGATKLYDTGNLVNRLCSEHSSSTASVGFYPVPGKKNGPRSISAILIHQFGGAAGRGRSANIPARPFMPIEGSGTSMTLMPVAERSITATVIKHFGTALS